MTPALTARVDSAQPAFSSIFVRIEFTVDDLRDGFHFVGCVGEDKRYPHAYTTKSPVPGAACTLFPCIDDMHEKCTWELAITVPRTLGDIQRAARAFNGLPYEEEQVGEEDEDSEKDMVVVCTGDMIDEVCHIMTFFF